MNRERVFAPRRKKETKKEPDSQSTRESDFENLLDLKRQINEAVLISEIPAVRQIVSYRCSSTNARVNDDHKETRARLPHRLEGEGSSNGIR